MSKLRYLQITFDQVIQGYKKYKERTTNYGKGKSISDISSNHIWDSQYKNCIALILPISNHVQPSYMGSKKVIFQLSLKREFNLNINGKHFLNGSKIIPNSNQKLTFNSIRQLPYFLGLNHKNQINYNNYKSLKEMRVSLRLLEVLCDQKLRKKINSTYLS